MKVVFISLVFIFIWSGTNGLKCYTCSASEGESDRRCITDPDSLDYPTKECDKKYCTSTRVESRELSDRVISMQRSCDDNPVINELREDATTRTYSRACRKDLCNGGPGTDLSNPFNEVNDGYGVLYVPGVEASGSEYNFIYKSLLITSFLLIIIIFI